MQESHPRSDPMTNEGRDVVILKGFNIEPGDRVLLTVAEDTAKYEESQRLLDEIRDRFPGVEFTLVGGVSGVAVERERGT